MKNQRTHILTSFFFFMLLAWTANSLFANQYQEDGYEAWLKMTFTNNSNFVNPVKDLMMLSREAGVNYRMPLGLTHLRLL